MVNIKAVVFDLYGTLIYIANDTKSYTRLFRNLGLQTPNAFKEARRIALSEDFDNLVDFVNRIKQNSQIDFDTYQHELEKELMSASLYPETLKVLDQLKEQDISLGLISNLASPYKKPFFDLGLNNYFNKKIFSCDIGIKKPNKQIYQTMVGKLKIKPAQILMIGDKLLPDVKGPKSIGMNAVYLDRLNNSANSISTLEGVFQYL